MKFSLLQWNAWTKENPEHILELLKEIQADVVCLQELNQNHPRNNYLDVPLFLSEQLEYHSFAVPAQTWPSDRGDEKLCNGIFSKYPLINKSFFFVSDLNNNPETDYSHEGRVAIFADIQLDQHLIQIATTHLSYVHKFAETSEKRDEEEKLLRLLSNQKERFVITGDFNADENSLLIEQLNQSFIHAGPDYTYKTWTTKPFSYQGFAEDRLAWRIDYVFSTPDIKALKSEIIRTPFSDHLPILVEMEILE